jgi:hypothetical protein
VLTLFRQAGQTVPVFGPVLAVVPPLGGRAARGSASAQARRCSFAVVGRSGS